MESPISDEEYYFDKEDYSIDYYQYPSERLLVKVVYFNEYEPYLRYTCSVGLLTLHDKQEICEKIGFDTDGMLEGVLEEESLGRFEIVESNDRGGFDFLEARRAFENGTGKIIDAMNEIKRIAQVIRDLRQDVVSPIEDSCDTEQKDTSKDKKNTHSKPACEKRDARIYELKQEGKSWADICDTIAREFNDPMDEGAATQALKRYCERHLLDQPKGKRGRKS
jgi:hypothetical protein